MNRAHAIRERPSLEMQRRDFICHNIKYLQRLAAASTDNPKRRINILRLLGEEMTKLRQTDREAQR